MNQLLGIPQTPDVYTHLCRYKHHETEQHRSSGMPVILRPDVRKQLLDDGPITTPLLCLGRKMNLFLRGLFPFFVRFWISCSRTVSGKMTEEPGFRWLR